MTITVLNAFELQVTSTNVTVGRLKQLIERRMHIPAAMQSLFFKGMELQDDGTLVQFDVDLNSTLILIVRGDGNQENPVLVNEDDEQGPDDAVGHCDQTQGHGFNFFHPYHQMPFYYGNQGNYANNLRAFCYGNQGGYANNLQAYNYMPWNGPLLNQWAPPDYAHHRNDLAALPQLAAHPHAPENIFINNQPMRITLHIMRSESEDILTTVDIELTDTVGQLKTLIQRYIGHDVHNQQLDAGGITLTDQSRIIDIPQLLISPVVYLTLLPGYWFNTY